MPDFQALKLLRALDEGVASQTGTSFFPHLVAGPIMRATNLLPQIERERRFDPAAARDASVLIVWGLFSSTVLTLFIVPVLYRVFVPTVKVEAATAADDGVEG